MILKTCLRLIYTNNKFSVLVALAAMCVCLNADGAETVELAPHTFTIAEGFELKRVAAPPLVQRPIHMCFDPQGVLYVTDSSGNTDKAPVQLKDPQHRVLRLVDRDGDGTFDESTVFADKLPLATYLPKGDALRGAKLFNNQDRSKCTICHLKGDKGVRLGPDLTWIGAIRSERDLLEAIVFPSASIARYHEVVNVRTKDGRVVSGLLVKETVDTLFLSSGEGVVQPVAFRDIEVARYSNVSLMPERLDRSLKPEEIADLVAYLKASKPTTGAIEVGK